MPTLTHSDLAKLFKGGFVHSLNNKTAFDQGVDAYILPSIINDIQTRVLRVKEDGTDLASVKADLSDWIKKVFWTYLHSEGVQNFSDFHARACEAVTAIFEKRYDGMTYGKAQKVVNMIFKYLYCFDGAIALEDKFKACHMPLDSKILDWYKVNVDKHQKTPWSKLEAEEYHTIQEKLKAHIAAHYQPYTVLEAEFVIWDQEINQ